MSQTRKISISRHPPCGSMYKHALVDKLSLVGAPKDPLIHPDGDDEISDEQTELFEDFTNAVCNYLVTNIDCENPEHGLTFRATEVQQNITNHIELSTSNKDSKKNLISTISIIGAEHLHSYDGFDDSSDDGGLHNTIRRIPLGEETEKDTVIWAYRALSYRTTEISIADTYILMMEISLSKGLLCNEHDIKNVRKDVGKGKDSILERFIFDRKVLFPRPIMAQGRSFSKDMNYLIAIFHYVDIVIDIAVGKLDELVAILEQNIERERPEMLKRDAEVMAERGKLFRYFDLLELRDGFPSQAFGALGVFN